MTLAFPFAMLTQRLSAGSMGGGVPSAVSRALGAGDAARAETLAGHASQGSGEVLGPVLAGTGRLLCWS